MVASLMLRASEGAASPKDLDPEKYEIDPDDGLPREIVGPWSLEKHERLRRYVDISGVGVRKSWLKNGAAGASYIDLFAGPGRVRVKTTGQVCDGGPLVAWRKSVESKAPFTTMFVSDAHPALATAAAARLRAAGAPVVELVGEATSTVDVVIKQLNPHALHFAFLDPFKLGVLPFDIIKKLSKLQRMDILLHISAHDTNRNLRRYIERPDSPIDLFAPNWRAHAGDLERAGDHVRGKILEHWRNLLRSVDMDTAEVHELVTGESRQPLYWLAFVARHPRAHDFWDKIRGIDKGHQAEMF